VTLLELASFVRDTVYNKSPKRDRQRPTLTPEHLFELTDPLPLVRAE
jgi:hypothetical protein